MAVTLKDVAADCGVSPSAVSQVLRSHHACRVSPAARERILASARRLGYRPNHISTSLRRQRSGLLSLILPWNNPELMEVMEQEAYRLGYRLMTNFLTRPDLDREIALLNNSLDWQVEGLFWLPYADLSAYPELLLQRLRGSKARIVFMQRRLPDVPGCLVGTDYRQGMRDAIAHVQDQGYRHVVFLGTPLNFEIKSQRQNYIQTECRERGLPCETILLDNLPGSDASASLVLSCLQTIKTFPYAIFCDNDSLAVHAVHALQKMNVDIPGQVGLIANGDQLVLGHFRLGDITTPSLTALSTDYTSQGRLAISRMVQMLKDNTAAPPDVWLPLPFRPRTSTALSHPNPTPPGTALAFRKNQPS